VGTTGCACPAALGLRVRGAGAASEADTCRVAAAGQNLSEAQVNENLESGAYGRMAAQVASNAAAGCPAQGQVMAQEAMRTRGLASEPQQAIQGTVISTPSPARAVHVRPPAGKQESPAPAIAMGFAAAIITGLVMTIAGLPDGTQIGSGPDLAILLPGLALLIGLPVAAVIIFIRSIHQANRRWLSTLPPGQRERVRKAQNYAIGLGAMAAVDLGLRAANKHADTNIARAQEAKQRRRAQAEGQQRHQELLDAIRQGGQDQGPQGLQPKRWIPPGTQ
jgi:hypothetical protein